MSKSKNKIKTLQELATLSEALRREGKKIVLCHGVFDLLHIGHIRYFESAKKHGQILLVTITSDAFVNKGPLRPAFTQDLRAEQLASLECVDYVAINDGPRATPAIKLLKPNFYAKGLEYKNPSNDPTGGIIEETEAIKSVGGEIVFVDEITFSSSSLIKRYVPLFSQEVSEYLLSFGQRYQTSQVLGYLENAKRFKVLLIGESIIDDYHYCEAIGKSSKEPMLALKHQTSEKFSGGILAVGNHVANFCDTVGMVSLLGDFHSEETFIKENLNPKIKSHFLFRKNSPTIVKRRYIENYFFMKLFEVYQMNDGALEKEDNDKLCKTLEEQIPNFDIVIVVDFGHGMLTDEAIDIICKKSKFLAINAQSNAGNIGYHTIGRYPRADFASMAENEIRQEARSRRGDMRKIVEQVSKKIHCDRIVVTQGKRGCLAYSKKEGFFEVPPFAGQVVDRMGAGDAFLSLTALCAAQNAPMEVVGFIGNAVGAQAVATVGHRSSIEKVPLFKQIESLLK